MKGLFLIRNLKKIIMSNFQSQKSRVVVVCDDNSCVYFTYIFIRINCSFKNKKLKKQKKKERHTTCQRTYNVSNAY